MTVTDARPDGATGEASRVDATGEPERRTDGRGFSTTADPMRLATLAGRVGAVGAVGVLVLETLTASASKSFSLDEFEYAHAAFLVGKGLVPYRDFVEVHFPFLFQVLAPWSAWGGSDPTQITSLRSAMLVPLAACCLAAWSLLRRHGPFVALLGPLLLLSTGPLVRFLIEIRGDGLAFALVVGALALTADRAGRHRSVLAGVVFGLACWTSQKVFVYGAIFPLVWLLSLGRAPPAFGGNIRAFAVGAVAVAAVVVAWLSATGSWGPAWHWCFAHFDALQEWATVLPWTESAIDVVRGAWHVIAFGVVGAVLVVRDDEASPGERILVAMWPLTFLSVAIQFAPYPYSYIPSLAIAGLLAARCAIHLLAVAGRQSQASAITMALLLTLLVAAHHSRSEFQRFVAKNDNTYQLAVLRTIDALVAPSETVYDNTGSFVARPSVLPKFFTDVFMRVGQAAQLEQEVLPVLQAHPPAMVVVDLRFEQLPAGIKDFVRRNYLPYSGELLLPGQRHGTKRGEPFALTISIARAGLYTLTGAKDVVVDGAEVSGAVLLTRGDHRVAGVAAEDELLVLQAPANNESWQPRFDLEPKYTRLF